MGGVGLGEIVCFLGLRDGSFFVLLCGSDMFGKIRLDGVLMRGKR